MKTMVLEWKTPDEIPDKSAIIVVSIPSYFYKYQLFVTKSVKDKKVDFLNETIVAWAYINTDYFNAFLSESKFNPEWINFLHDNAVK